MVDLADGTTRYGAVDLMRGLAVISMVVAHTAPVGGVFNVSEYLTAPLFALVVGSSMAFALQRTACSFPSFWLRQIVRAAILILLGTALQLVHGGIFDVLISLGLLTVLLPPLAWLGQRRRGIVVITIAASAVAMPLLRVAGQAWLAAHDPDIGLLGPTTVCGQLVFWTVAHPTYRLPAFVVAAGLGVLLAPVFASQHARARPLAIVASACAGASGIAVLVGKRTGWGGDPYAGTWPELTASTLVAVAAALGCLWLWRTLPAARRSPLAPVVAVGRLALSCYCVHVLALAAIAAITGQPDDGWWVMVSLIVTLLALATLWLRTVGPLGPAEWLLRLPHRTRGPGARSVG